MPPTSTTTSLRSIPNYPNYSVSNSGVVYGPKGPLKPNKNSRGYYNVSLVSHANGRKAVSHSVHRLVAAAFVHRPTECTEVNHKDYDKANNAAINLEWVTSSANKLHATAFGLYPVGAAHYKYVDGSSDRGRIVRRSVIKQQYEGVLHGN